MAGLQPRHHKDSVVSTPWTTSQQSRGLAAPAKTTRLQTGLEDDWSLSSPPPIRVIIGADSSFAPLRALPLRPTELQLPPIRPIFYLFGLGTGSTCTSWSSGTLRSNLMAEAGMRIATFGDVLLHCVVDAIFGALGLLDIRHIFPDSEPKWRDAASSGGEIFHCDRT
ncbi:hypothetical protein ACFXTH_012811 [Malus domestica]|nr:uncharacterized protein LOC114820396 [Malus domestica]